MKTVEYNLNVELDIIENSDVVVVGGGPAGIGAAVMAARSGAKTLLVERYALVGGMATHGEVTPFMPNHVKDKSLDKLVYPELIKEMKAFNPTSHEINSEDNNAGRFPFDHVEKPKYRDRIISKTAMALAAEKVCMNYGVNIIYHHALVDVIKSRQNIDYLILHSKSGFSAVSGKIFIDCTGDGDLAALSGCEYEIGNENGNCQPMTLCFKVSNIEISKMPSRAEICEKYNMAKASGEIDCHREDILYFLTHKNDVIHFNTTRIIRKSGINGKELSDAEKEGRRQMLEIFQFLKKKIPGFQNAELHSIANHIGVRETRRIKGISYISKDVFINRQKFPDSIAKVNYMIDIHSPEGAGTEMIRLNPDEWYEVPYGCVVAKDIDNLLVGGRAISTDRAINSSLRVMPCAISTGCACGVAAAMSVDQSVNPSALYGVDVHERLKYYGADL